MVKIIVRVKAGAKIDKIEKIDGANYKAWVKAPAKEGKANAAVVKALAKYFGTAKSSITITSGFKAKMKTVRVEE